MTPGVVVLDACLNARLFTPEELHSAAAALNRTTGISRVRVAVSRCSSGAQSPRETELRLFVEDLGYETETQFPVSISPDQPPFAHTDLRIRGTRALLEYDGEEKYEGGTAAPLLAERSRERRIERLGWRVERVVARDLRNRRALARRVHMLVQE